ncbi:universal stress protein [Streptomyces sediminimaris]|uniref:universal stress protein n=1 Tax=Streptomyces sediminimaris TaxID=3383721 RepID=UPI00399B5776
MLRPVVVGLDGSRESLAAADWAAGEALRRGLPLRLVHAWVGLSPEASRLPELEAPRHWARRILRTALDQVEERHPQVRTSAEQIALPAVQALEERHPQVRTSAEQIALPAVQALVEAAAEAELLVLGSRAFGGFGGYLAGSVALATVARATRPVVLVRADRTPEDEHLPDAAGLPSRRAPYRDVVAGVDVSRPCEELLAFSFESAALRNAPLRVVHAWHAPFAPPPAAATTGAAARGAAERALADALRPWHEKFPNVRVRTVVADARPAQHLPQAARDACLLVVGRRIRPTRLGTHTGPVAHAAMHRARCPVAVVPHE